MPVPQIGFSSAERFRRLTNELKKECLEIAKNEMAAQAERLVQLMKAKCPVNADPPPQAGLLRDSIGWTFGEPPTKRGLMGSVRTRPGNSNEIIANVYAGNNEAFYARWVEFGTQAHSIGKGADISRSKRQSRGGQHPGSPAQPFFWPSYRLLKNSMRAAVKQKLISAIEKRSSL